MNKNKGAVSVLLCVVFVSMVLAAGAAGDTASLATASSYSTRINYLACKSILAGYDINLFKDYGLIGFEGGYLEIEEDVEDYINMMRRVNEDSLNETIFFDLELKDVSADCKGRSLANADNFMKQVKEQMKYIGLREGINLAVGLSGNDIDLKGLRKQTSDEIADANASSTSEDGPSGEGEQRKPLSLRNNQNFTAGVGESDRVLRSDKVIASFLSDYMGEDESKTDFGLKEEEELLDLGEESSDYLDLLMSSLSAGTDKIVMSQYISFYFKNAVNSREKSSETFFTNETEYIIKGSLSDKRNYQSVKSQLFLLRTALNMVHIYSDSEKNRLTLEMATAMSVGLSPTAVQFLLVTAWAGAEAREDLKILYSGGEIPFFKNSEDWRLSFDAVRGGGNSTNPTDTGKGLDYSSYLQLLMMLKSRNELIYRSMDLIQINMKGRYGMAFDLRNYHDGFSVKTDFDRKAYLPQVIPGIIEDNYVGVEGVFEY